MNKSRHRHKAGLPPGTSVHIGRRKVKDATISLVEFSPEMLRTEALEFTENLKPAPGNVSISWIGVVGLHDTTLLEKFGRLLGIHPLLLEDIANTEQRPKIEIDEDCVFIVARIVQEEKDNRSHLNSEQISLIIAGDFLLTFRERPGPIFDSVRQHLEVETSRLRRRGPDFLAYALLDAIVDTSAVALDTFSDKIDDLEEAVLENPEAAVTKRAHRLKSELTLIRRATSPLREIIAVALRGESPLIGADTQRFLKDLYENGTIRVGP